MKTETKFTATLTAFMLLIMLISFSIGSVIGYNLGITRGKERQSVIDAKTGVKNDTIMIYDTVYVNRIIRTDKNVVHGNTVIITGNLHNGDNIK